MFSKSVYWFVLLFCLSHSGDLFAAEVTQLVFVPGGNYQPLYGTTGQEESVAPFAIDQTPVTIEQYVSFVKKNPRWRRSKVVPIFADSHYLEDWKNDLSPGVNSALPKDSPVTHVSWFAAKAYCEAQGKRLPTLNEWEFVGQASEIKTHGSKDAKFRQRILDWYSQPYQPKSVSRGFKNVYGVVGLHGLVWEWVSDFNSILISGESRGDTGLDRNLFCARGALDAGDVSDYAAFIRYAFRASLKANYATGNLGFRCAKGVQ